MTIVTPTPEISRDRWGRPLVTPPGGGKPVAYTRATTFIDVIEDRFNLQQWEKRMVATGLATRPDLLLSVSAHLSDKKQLNRICDDAKEAAAASASATTGTALHALTEIVDRGEQLPVGLPAAAVASLEAYRAATAGLKYRWIEQFCVMDQLQVGGTPDRIGSKILDLKTGSIEWGYVKIAAQLALYSRSKVYDIATGERSIHGADLTEGIVIHCPAVEDPADARCDLYAVDLTVGWDAVMVAKRVREKRKLKFSDVMHPLEASKPGKEAPAPSLQDQIRACATAEAVRALWTPEWSDELNAFAAAHIATLQEAS